MYLKYTSDIPQIYLKYTSNTPYLPFLIYSSLNPDSCTPGAKAFKKPEAQNALWFAQNMIHHPHHHTPARARCPRLRRHIAEIGEVGGNGPCHPHSVFLLPYFPDSTTRDRCVPSAEGKSYDVACNFFAGEEGGGRPYRSQVPSGGLRVFHARSGSGSDG